MEALFQNLLIEQSYSFGLNCCVMMKQGKEYPAVHTAMVYPKSSDCTANYRKKALLHRYTINTYHHLSKIHTITQNMKI